MKFTIVGLFYDVQTAKNVCVRLEEEGIFSEEVALISKGDRLDPFADLPLRATNVVRSGLRSGVACGLLAALAAVAVGGPAGLVGAGILAATAFGGSAGGAFGFLGGALAGSGSPKAEAKEAIRRMENGESLLIVHVEGTQAAETGRRVFEERGDVVYQGPV